MRIGILQCGHTPETVAARHGGYDAMFARLFEGEGFDFTTWNVVDMDFPEGPDAAQGWIVSGSRHGVYDDLPFIAPAEDLVRRLAGSGRPVLGICFGHQLIAQALGGQVEKFKGGWSVGAKTYHWVGLGDVVLTAWHQDQVIVPPDGARTVATNNFTRHAALAYGDSILTVQPHPEFSTEVAASYLEAYAGSSRYPDGVLEDASRRLSRPLDDHRVGQHMARFLRQRAVSHV